jgi:hypothetical protein
VVFKWITFSFKHFQQSDHHHRPINSEVRNPFFQYSSLPTFQVVRSLSFRYKNHPYGSQFKSKDWVTLSFSLSIVAYPEAVERHWNDGRRLSQYRSQRENIDDEIKGDSHTWPGGNQYLPEFLIGKTNRDLNASETIWNFFNGHRR